MHPFTANGHITDLVSSNLPGQLCFSLKRVGRARASLISGEGDLLSHPNGNGIPGQLAFVNQKVNQPSRIELKPDAIGFGTLSAEITPSTPGAFFDNNDEYDLDHPTEGFASIPEAIEEICQGKVSSLPCYLIFAVQQVCLGIAFLQNILCY